MSYASTFPAAAARLVTVWSSSPGLAGVLTADMISLPDTAAEEAVIVAWRAEGDDTAAEGTMTAEGYAGTPDRESYDIHCALAVRDGGGNLAAARARAFALLGACGQALAADRKLGGVVLTAVITTWSLLLDLTGDGALARIRFDVNIDAYTTR